MKFEFDHKTGMMRPKKDEEIYFAQSQGGGLIVDDKKNNIKYVIERDGRITKLFGSFDKSNLNLYDMRDARIIADRVRRLLGVDHKYSDFHYFLRGYHMNESVIESCSDFIDESFWGDVHKRSRGDEMRKEDEFSKYDSNEGRLELLRQMYDALVDKGLKKNLDNEPYSNSVGDDICTVPWTEKNNKDSEEYAFLAFNEDTSFFDWTFNYDTPEKCSLGDLFCGIGLKSVEDGAYTDTALCIDFFTLDEEGNQGDWQTLNYSFFDDIWFYGFNSDGELNADEIDEFLANIISTITPILNKNTKYTQTWFLKK
jgi:hypothetical protein